MPTNHYFSRGSQNEQWLYEDLLIESIRIYGHDLYYLPRTIISKDQLFGEDPLSQFNDAYMVEMYMETVDGYDGEKELISRFGLEIRDETTFIVSRRRWDQLVGTDQNLIETARPQEGDWIYMPQVGKVFEISFVDHDDPFYQVSNLPVYKLFCRTAEYSNEDINTGVKEIDKIEDIYSTDAMDWRIVLEDSTGLLLESGRGENSFYLLDEEYFSNDLNDNFIPNNNVIDFTEHNPFGDPRENF